MSATPRIEFNDDGESMDIDQAVERFREMLLARNDFPCVSTVHGFSVDVRVRLCDCAETLAGRDEFCPLHGEGA